MSGGLGGGLRAALIFCVNPIDRVNGMTHSNANNCYDMRG
jgi:hypothetical protein